ncbi:Sec34-like family-domain-containing protein [Lactifluus volemus]|nr:Sec34-like family-domain-containing protein [Lactifluus volemus]
MFPGYPLQFSVIAAFTRGLWQCFPSINSLQRVKLCSVSRPPTPGSRQPAVAHAHAIHPKQPVQTSQQFYDWFALIDRSVVHSQEAHFRHHLLRVSEHLDTCDRLVGHIDQVDTEVANMLDKWKSMEEGGKSLQDASQKLLDERVRIASLTHISLGRVEELDGCVVFLQDRLGAANGYRTTLEYFQELEHAMRLLNHPGESLVLQIDFLYMVERVDICIEFLKLHRNYKEAEVYLLRFQQCMTCAMTFIKMYFVGSLRALTQDVSRRLFEQDDSESDTAQMHLLCTRFTTVAGQLELGALLSECHVGTRKILLTSRLAEQIRGLDPTKTEIVELTRAGRSCLKQICTEEFDLYRAFFSTGKQELHTWKLFVITSTTTTLPRILHEPRLTVLCEVCTVLQALMVLDQPLDDEIEENQETLDAQTRLFFKAQAVIQSDIRYYTPTAKDLAYPISSLEITRNLDLAQKDEPQGGGGSGGTDQYGVAGQSSPRAVRPGA